MIQRWKREKAAGDQTALQVHFLFIFQEMSDDDFRQIELFRPIPPVSQQISVLRTTYPKCSLIQRWRPEIWPPQYYWFYSKICSSLYRLFSSSFFFFFLTSGLCSFIGTIFHNYNFVPHSCVFYFIFHVNYLVYFCLNHQYSPNSDWDEIFNQGRKTY